MASNSKKAVALVLTAMMAATSLVGCNSGSGSSGGSTTTTSTAASTASGDTSAEESVVDLESDETIKLIKDKIAAEAEKTDGKITMKVWCSSGDLKFEKTLIKEFEDKYADSRYTFSIKPNGAIGEDAAGGKIIESPKDGADVFNFADDQLSQLVEAEAIAKVSNVFNGNVKKNNTDDAVAVCSSGGTPYAFPKTSDNGYFLYYDKRVLSEDDVKDFDTMIAKAKAANKSVFFDIANGWYSTSFFFTAGCTIEYKDGKQTATYNTPEGLSAAKAMCHIAENVDNGFIGAAGSSGDNSTVQQGFKEGKFAAAIIGTWCGRDIKDALGEQNVGAAKLPTVLMDGEQKQLHSFGGYKVVGVNAFTKYPTTAQALAYYLTSEQSQIKRYNERGLIPTNKNALEDETIKADPAQQAIAAQREFAHPQGSSVGGKYWASNIAGLGSEILNAKGKLTDAELNKKLSDLVTQFKG